MKRMPLDLRNQIWRDKCLKNIGLLMTKTNRSEEFCKTAELKEEQTKFSQVA